jgi:hypothetical protein
MKLGSATNYNAAPPTGDTNKPMPRIIIFDTRNANRALIGIFDHERIKLAPLTRA